MRNLNPKQLLDRMICVSFNPKQLWILEIYIFIQMNKDEWNFTCLVFPNIAIHFEVVFLVSLMNSGLTLILLLAVFESLPTPEGSLVAKCPYSCLFFTENR